MKKEVNEIPDSEIEEYFKDAKKKSFPIGILFGIIILVLIAVFCFYYFVIDSPKVIIYNYYNSLLKNYSSNKEYNSVKYDFNYKFNSDNSDYVDLFNILNKISFNGNIDIDIDNMNLYSYINILYNSQDLLDLSGYYDDKYIYFKSNKLFDKTIMSEIIDDSTDNKKDIDDSEINDSIKEHILDNLVKSLDNAKYEKRYKRGDSSFVKEIKLRIDEDFFRDFYGNLLNDNEFIEKVSLKLDISESELKDQINKIVNDIDEDYLDIIIDLSVFDNKFLKIDVVSEDIRIVIEKEDNGYNYKYYDNSIIMYQGSLKLYKEDNNYKLDLVLDIVEDDLVLDISGDFSFDKIDNINRLDNNTILFDDMTEDDYNKIVDNVSKNLTLQKLIEDVIEIVFPEYNFNI